MRKDKWQERILFQNKQKQIDFENSIKTFNEYGNLLILRTEIDIYKSKLGKFKVRECIPKSKRCVIIERTR